MALTAQNLLSLIEDSGDEKVKGEEVGWWQSVP
jgi:hypothetical protein